ncbi:hypothetical protein Tco_1176975 [Tanacetum coccineum]
MLNKDNYVPWSSRLLRYAKSKPNRKLLVNSIKNGLYVRQMIIEPGDPNSVPPVAESTHEQTNDELTEKEVNAQEIWLRVEQTMKGFSIEVQEKKAKLFNEWERFTSTNGESIESYYHRFSKLINDFSRNKHFPEKIASNLKYLNNPQPEWQRYVTIVHQTKDLYEVDYIQLLHSKHGLELMVMGIMTQLLIAQKEEVGIQLQAKEFDLMVTTKDIDEIEEVNVNCILMENLQQALTSSTHTKKALVYDSDGSAEVYKYENCYNNEIFNMFTQEEQYTELLEPITEPYQVQQNDSNVISEVSSMEQSGGILEQHHTTVEETRAYFESLYNHLVPEVEKVNTVNGKMKEKNADLTAELARYRGQEKSFKINKVKFDELETSYRKFVYQEQCLTKKINVLHLSSAKQITALNEEISNLNVVPT